MNKQNAQFSKWFKKCFKKVEKLYNNMNKFSVKFSKFPEI